MGDYKEKTQPANSQDISCPQEKSSDSVFMERASFMLSSFLQVPLFCRQSFSYLFRGVIQLPGRSAVVYMLCIQSQCFVCSIGTRYQILFQQPLIHYCPTSVLFSSVLTHIFVSQSAAGSAFSHVVGLIFMCMCTSWTSLQHPQG